MQKTEVNADDIGGCRRQRWKYGPMCFIRRGRIQWQRRIQEQRRIQGQRIQRAVRNDWEKADRTTMPDVGSLELMQEDDD